MIIYKSPRVINPHSLLAITLCYWSYVPKKPDAFFDAILHLSLLFRHEDPIELVWSSTLRTAPFTSAALLYDLDGDSLSDIIAANVAGEVWAVHGESGHVIDGWPFYLEDRSFHSTPLLVNVCVCVCL